MKFLFPLIIAGSIACAQQSIAVTGPDGKALNLGFETGTLDCWTATGTAFEKQPIKGDAVAPRRNDMKSQHAGEYWIGGFEVHGNDKATGTLTSASFKVTQPWASFLFAGGETEKTRVELVTKDDGKVFHKVWSKQEENLRRSLVDLRKLQGREIFIRLVDEHTGHWGHINFDDFVFHAAEPKFIPTQLAKAPEPALSLDVVEHAGLKPEEVPGAAKVPDGYELKVFAAEPDIINPISFCLDERGRAWVVEGMTYPNRAKEEPGTKPGLGGQDRILVFEDTNGDHKFDKRTVFMEGANLVSGIEVGFGGVWLGAAPYLLFVPVENWDEPKPKGDPQVLLDGWGFQDTHETLNTFHWGPDGWLYGCHGVFTHSNVGKPGAADKDRVKINAGIWRYHPQAHKFEVFAEGTSNPWGLDWNADGDLFIEACVIPHLFHIIQGARYTRQAGAHFNPNTYDDIKTIADHRHYLGNAGPHAGNGKSDAAGGGHAHAGLCIPQHPSWPDSIRGKALMGNIHGSRINMDILERKGSGFVGKHGADFINFNDKASQIVDIREGPGGEIWMIDWYDLNQCHRPDRKTHDYTTGRVLKLVRKGAKAAPMTKLTGLSNEDLVGLVKNEDPFVWRAACRRIQEQKPGKEAADKLWEKLFTENPPDKASAGFWQRVGWLGAATTNEHSFDQASMLYQMLQPAMPPTAFAGLVSASLQGKIADTKLPAALLELAKNDKSPSVRLSIASGCQRMTVDERKPILLALLAHEEDKDDHNLPLMYWYAAEPVVGADPAWAAEAIGACKIPKVTEFISRRLAGK